MSSYTTILKGGSKMYKNLKLLTKPNQEEVKELEELISTNTLVYMDIESDSDEQSVIFYKGNILFISSNTSVCGIKSKGNGVSLIFNQKQDNSDIPIHEEYLKIISNLPKSEIYYAWSDDYDQLLAGIRHISFISDKRLLARFFEQYKVSIQKAMG